MVSCWYIQVLPLRLPSILQSQKTAEEKWPKSAEHKHDAWQAEVDDLLKDIGLFKRKVKDDKERFPHPEKRVVLGEVQVN